VAFADQATLSDAAFAAVFVAGIAVQYVRHSGAGFGGSDVLS
jgi:hypothetical protein